MVKWGIIGAGRISEKFIKACNVLKDDCIVTAVAANDNKRAKDFASRFNIENYYGSYEDMLKSADIDAVYIGNIHPMHYGSCMLAMKYNKHILCEKPFSMNAKDSAEVFELAKIKNLFCMEALWTRFNPIYKMVFEWIDKGYIGKVKSIYADYSSDFAYNEDSRLFNKKSGGGALLDIGIYPLNFAAMFLKSEIVSIKSQVELLPSKVDDTTEILIKYSDGTSAVISCSFSRLSGNNGYIYGQKGYIHVPDFHKASKCILRNSSDKDTVYEPKMVDKFAYQIMEANACIKNGEIVSKTMPPEETIKIQKIMDNILADNKIIY